MKRPLFNLLLAAALDREPRFAMGVAPARRARALGVTIGTGGWDNDGWHDNGLRLSPSSSSTATPSLA